jgi:predicted MPP superfamily phosphohydrolase
MHSKPRFLIFIPVVLAILFLANWAVYAGLIAAFSIVSHGARIVIGSALGFLSGGFVLFMVLGNYFYNFLTRFFYTLTAVWLGVLPYVFFASVVVGACAAVGGNSPFLAVAGKTLFAIAAVASAYGFFHARDTKIRRISVSLPNLPEYWHGKRALFLSDIHLGQVHGIAYAKKITALANSVSPDIIFVGGDLFDGTGAPDVKELAEPFCKLRATHGVFYVTGNHEEFGDNSQFLAAVAHAGMRALMDEIADVEGLQIVGVDYRNSHDPEQFAGILAGLSIDPTKPSILLKHEPKDVPVASAAGISLMISGHTHKGQEWPFGYLAKKIYKEFTYGLVWHNDMHMYTSSGVGTWGPPVRVGTDSELVEITFS